MTRQHLSNLITFGYPVMFDYISISYHDIYE